MSAAAGSVASQAVGVATGIQQKFSWNGVALAAIGGGVGGAMRLDSASGWGQAAANGAARSIVTQGIGVATGMQKKFSWAGVAAAGIGAGVFEAIGGNALPALKGENLNVQNFVNHLGANGANALANAATRSLIEGTDFGDNMLAAIPDVLGQTIGNAIAGGIQQAQDRARLEKLRQAYREGKLYFDDSGGERAASGVTRIRLDENTPSSPVDAFKAAVETSQMQLAALDELSDAEIGSDAATIRKEAVERANALFDAITAYSSTTDGAWGYVQSYAGGAAGVTTGVPRGMWDSVVGLWNMVTHPGETLRGLGSAIDYANSTSVSKALADGSMAFQTFEAGIKLEQARIYLTEGHFNAAFFEGHEAGRIAGAIAGPGKLADVLLASRAARAAGGAVGAGGDIAGATAPNLVGAIGSLVRTNPALRAELVRIVSGNGASKWTEARGVLFAAREGARLGYDFKASVVYNNSGHGIDAVFSRQVGGVTRYAVWEAKGGKWTLDPSDLAVDSKGTVQLSDNFITTRLQRAYDAAPNGPNASLIRTLQTAYRAGTLDRFVSFRGSRSTYQVRPYPTDPSRITY
ncbi:MAG: hypothetical protein IV086_06345 [Hyphomonadaceae bacterium]|nr:hypothetical protein [Hyphomonadaceae bacterium]